MKWQYFLWTSWQVLFFFFFLNHTYFWHMNSFSDNFWIFIKLQFPFAVWVPLAVNRKTKPVINAIKKYSHLSLEFCQVEISWCSPHSSTGKKFNWWKEILSIIEFMWCVHACCFSHLWLFEALWTVNCHVLLSMGFSCGRMEWAAVPSIRRPSQPRNQTYVS